MSELDQEYKDKIDGYMKPKMKKFRREAYVDGYDFGSFVVMLMVVILFATAWLGVPSYIASPLVMLGWLVMRRRSVRHLQDDSD